MNPSLAGLDERVAEWFFRRHGAPTDIQARAWPRITGGEHVIATAPTGSGKTLCAFLVPLDRLLTGAWPTGAVRVLYVSPLKALNNDIQRNLVEPLAELSECWRASGVEPPEIRVMTRSGDTATAERRRMQRRPPEILITTPESLNILLTSSGGRAMLTGVRMAILDEIHAVAGNRRGLWLMHGVEALTELAGEFQRVALSATVKPLESVAALVGGHRPGADGAPEARTRPVSILRSDASKDLRLRVRALEPDVRPGDGGLDALGPIAEEIGHATERNRSTLAFANSRALCEKLAMRVNDARETPLAWAHHGSLSREIRLEVEERLKSGRLRAIVATSSLEMGIDIGHLDEVLMVQAPPSVAAAVQRAGRAGHGVGETSHATLFPTHPQDAITCAVLARAALAGDIEETRIPGPALDVLAQMIVVRIAMAPRSADALFEAVRCIAPFRALPREGFDAVLAMLLGRFADTRLRDLAPRLLEDPDADVLRLRRGTLLSLYGSGGMIPDRGYYQLRHAASGERIGELDEEFVWENGPGKAFSMGSRQWRVQRVTHNDVFVTPAPDAPFAPPFWRAEARDRDAHLSRRMAEFLRDCEQVLAAGGREALAAELADDVLDAPTCTLIADHLERQRKHTERALPHVDHLLVERVRRGPGAYASDGGQLVLHTLAGGAVNRPWSLVLAARWRDRFGETPEVFAANDVIVVQGAADVADEILLDLLTADGVDERLRAELEDSGTFGARFRESAARSLLISRGRMGERLPLWMSRIASQRLLARVRRYPDFPVLLEAWRSCLREEFDLPALQDFIDRLSASEIRLDDTSTASPSPFAAESGWRQINEYMYADDRPRDRGRSSIEPTLLESVVADARLRPAVTRAIAEAFVARRRRLITGWGPTSALEVRDWLRERRLMRRSELEAHAAAAGLQTLSDLAGWRALPWREDWVVEVREWAAVLRMLDPEAPIAEEEDSARAGDRLRLLSDWLAYEAPQSEAALTEQWPGDARRLALDLRTLVDDGSVISGVLIEQQDEVCVCDTENHEAMLRMQRAARRPELEPVAPARVADFLARWQRIDTATDIVDAVEGLRGLPIPVDLLEPILIARLGARASADLDALLASGALLLTGHGTGKTRDLCLLDADEIDLVSAPRSGSDDDLVRRLELALPDPRASYDFEAFLASADGDAAAAAALLWDGVFAGHVACERLETLHHGAATGFALPEAGAGNPASLHARRGGLRARIRARVRGVPGRFRRIREAEAPSDAVDRMQLARRRARLLVDRWGVVCPALLRREARGMRWGEVFRALRLMELAGEVTTGQFLEGLDGPQFASADAVALIRTLNRAVSGHAARWLDARDPASPAGLPTRPGGLDAPARRAGVELVLANDRIVLVIEGSGTRLHVDADADAADLDAAMSTLAKRLEQRSVAHLTVRSIDGEAARSSTQVPRLERYFRVEREHRGLQLSPISEGIGT